MARSSLAGATTDLVDDSGAVLFSLVRGEQFEYPIILDFLERADVDGYEYEAVVVEGANDGSGQVPRNVMPGGAQLTLGTRTAIYKGEWDPSFPTSFEEYVLEDTTYYKRRRGIGVYSSTAPSLDPDNWVEFDPSTLYIQIPKQLSIIPAWSLVPDVGMPVYGFFELRVTEPISSAFRHTWKPVRGVVQIMFSPTEIVPD
jgi:hypothetical protein